MVRLCDLDGQFVKLVKLDGSSFRPGCTFAEADGVMFLCPSCYAKNGGKVGTHNALVWFTGKVAPEIEPGPGRWDPSGTSIDDLTLSPSIHFNKSCGWHGFVRNGDAT